MVNLLRLYYLFASIVARPFLNIILKYSFKTKKTNSNFIRKKIIIEGFYNNPNHFLRLKILINSLLLNEQYQIIGLLYNKKNQSINTLKALGVSKFYFVEDTKIKKIDFKKSDNFMRKVKTHEDFLKLEFPDKLPPDIVYDTVLRMKMHPQPNINDESWVNCLADAFRLTRFYEKVLISEKPDYFILSNPFKNEYGIGLWKALLKNITCFHLTGYYETIRIKKFTSIKDFYHPLEVLPYKEFLKLPRKYKVSLMRNGKNFLKIKENSKNLDISHKSAYGSKKNINSLESLKNNRKPIILIACHAWFDFPHLFGMRNFSDFLDWINTIINIANKKDKFLWLIRPHPQEDWYGGFKLKDIINKEVPNHIQIVNKEYSTDQILSISDFVVTHHGTIAMEAVSKSIPVLCTDKNHYSDWDFCNLAKSKKDFINQLKNIEKLKKPNTKQIKLANLCAFLILGPNRGDKKVMYFLPDHFSAIKSTLFIFKILFFKRKDMQKQILKVNNWINSNNKSFSIFERTFN